MIPHPGREIVPKAEFKGPKVVPLNNQANLRHIMKRFVKEASRPGVKAITFVIERRDGVHIESSHPHDIDTATILIKSGNVMRTL